MNSLCLSVFACLLVASSALPLDIWGQGALIGASGIVTRDGAIGPSGTVSGIGAIGPNGLLNSNLGLWNGVPGVWGNNLALSRGIGLGIGNGLWW